MSIVGNGIFAGGGGGSATLITKSIAANGTYNASDDSADGYSSVSVNVQNSGITYSDFDVNGYPHKAKVGGIVWNANNYSLAYFSKNNIGDSLQYLEEIDIGSGLAGFGYGFADNCTNLREIKGDTSSITIISRYAFRRCSFLTRLTLTASTVVTLPYSASDVFAHNAVTEVYVPANLLASYKADTNWSPIASRIFAITE